MGLLKSLFSGKTSGNLPAFTDFSSIKTDIHSHLIPGLDDGVQTLEESLQMIRGFQSLGFQKLITTPHIMSDYFKNTPQIIQSGLMELRGALRHEGISMEIDAAAEYYVDEMFLKKLNDEPLLTIGEKTVLIEISYVNPPENLQQVLFEIHLLGYTPLLAHPERYPFWYGKFEEYRNLKDAGVMLQLNVNSLAGYYGAGARKTAERLIDEGLIDYIGSDLHGQRHLDVLSKVIKEKYLRKLMAGGVKNSLL
ncbi:MAG: capsular biosynthesis protein [Bacteroidia bacterium]|nr:capsular biosynthesis protein [Bacteroidia bacterium]